MDLFEEIYANMIGVCSPEHAMKGVKNAFQEGLLCMEEYGRMREHYQRVCDRLGLEDWEDPDLDMMVYHMEQIQKELCRQMFRYGIQFAAKE